MVFAFYGNYFLLLKGVEQSDSSISLKEFLAKKPQLAENLMVKLERSTTKLIEKGLIRHSVV